MVRVVTGVMRNAYGEFLLGRRSGRAYRGCWETPGGKVEPGETNEEALSREWVEELSLAVDVVQCVFEGRFTTKDLIDFSMHAYEVEVLGISRSALDYRMNGGPMGPNHDLVQWVSRAEIMALSERERVPSLWPIVQALTPSLSAMDGVEWANRTIW